MHQQGVFSLFLLQRVFKCLFFSSTKVTASVPSAARGASRPAQAEFGEDGAQNTPVLPSAVGQSERPLHEPHHQLQSQDQPLRVRGRRPPSGLQRDPADQQPVHKRSGRTQTPQTSRLSAPQQPVWRVAEQIQLSSRPGVIRSRDLWRRASSSGGEGFLCDVWWSRFCFLFLCFTSFLSHSQNYIYVFHRRFYPKQFAISIIFFCLTNTKCASKFRLKLAKKVRAAGGIKYNVSWSWCVCSWPWWSAVTEPAVSLESCRRAAADLCRSLRRATGLYRTVRGHGLPVWSTGLSIDTLHFTSFWSGFHSESIHSP